MACWDSLDSIGAMLWFAGKVHECAFCDAPADAYAVMSAHANRSVRRQTQLSGAAPNAFLPLIVWAVSSGAPAAR